MSNTVLYAVIGTFANEDNDVVLDYFDNLEDAEQFESEFESEDLEFTRIYKLVRDDESIEEVEEEYES